MVKSDEYWKEKLTPKQYAVLREKATEPPFYNEYFENKEDGMYHCAACGAALFSSDTKFESGSGWPSFYKAVNNGAIELKEDLSHGMVRTEAVCSNCGGHLGHVFDVWPKADEEKKYYCINSCALDFKKIKE